MKNLEKPPAVGEPNIGSLPPFSGAPPETPVLPQTVPALSGGRGVGIDRTESVGSQSQGSESEEVGPFPGHSATGAPHLPGDGTLRRQLPDKQIHSTLKTL